MKKTILFLLVLLILCVAGIYVFIPATLTVNNVVFANCSSTGANRTIANKENWKKFWQGKVQMGSASSFTNNDFFIHQDDTFRVTQLLQNAMRISISADNRKMQSLLLFLPRTTDSVQINWSYQVTTSFNPLKRIQQYNDAIQTKKMMAEVLHNMAGFVSNSKNVYGFPITQTSTKDTFLVSTKQTFDAYPSTPQVYVLIEKLQTYAKQNGARQTGYPMMNVTQLSKELFVLMTAIPVDKLLPEKNEITYKRMVPGNFLTATIKGGEGTVQNAQAQMQLYFQDYNRTAMAIPFQYLVIDRNKEKDTSQWVTKLYYPVM